MSDGAENKCHQEHSETLCATHYIRRVLMNDTMRRPRLPFTVIAKPTGAACNLDCQYCFFLSKELLYDSARQMMSEEVLESYIRQFLAASPDG